MNPLPGTYESIILGAIRKIGPASIEEIVAEAGFELTAKDLGRVRNAIQRLRERGVIDARPVCYFATKCDQRSQ